jgi:hypothetical protein
MRFLEALLSHVVSSDEQFMKECVFIFLLESCSITMGVSRIIRDIFTEPIIEMMPYQIGLSGINDDWQM